jgi:hypothetical protein
MGKITRHGGPSNRHEAREPEAEAIEGASADANPAASDEVAEPAPEEPAVKAAPRRRTRGKS